MSKIIIGIDPDSDKHGIAIYYGGKLEELHNMTLMNIYDLIDNVLMGVAADNNLIIEAHIEDVCANNAVFMPPSKNPNKIAEAKARGRTLGMCQQSQKELERLFDYWDIKVIKHKISKQWKSQISKKQFALITGWNKSSNEDNRSAAWMGYQGLNK